MNAHTEVNTRRNAIARAARAVVRLAADSEAIEPAHRQTSIVNDPRFTDTEAWDAVQALEGMVTDRGLITDAEIEADRVEAQQRTRHHLDANLAQLAHPEQDRPEARSHVCRAYPGYDAHVWTRQPGRTYQTCARCDVIKTDNLPTA